MPDVIVSEAQRLADPEEPLLAALAGGDSTALERWFHRHQPGVYAFAYFRVGRDPDLTADATQATFALALERLADFDPGRGAMATWLCTLARNVIRRLLAQHRRDVPLDGNTGGGTSSRIDESLWQAWTQMDSQALPPAVVERQETRELVAVALESLPAQYAEMLRARYLRDEPLEAIAREKTTTLDGVKSMLRRARAAFRDGFLALAEDESVNDEVA